MSQSGRACAQRLQSISSPSCLRGIGDTPARHAYLKRTCPHLCNIIRSSFSPMSDLHLLSGLLKKSTFDSTSSETSVLPLLYLFISIISRLSYPQASSPCINEAAESSLSVQGWRWVDEGKTERQHKWGLISTEPGAELKLRVCLLSNLSFPGNSSLHDRDEKHSQHL